MNQFKLLDVDLNFSPRLAADVEGFLGNKPKRPAKSPKRQAKLDQMTLTAGRWYVLQRNVSDGQRSSLIVIEGDELSAYLKPKKGWVPWQIVGEACATREEAADLAEAWSGMMALESPEKAPNREGTREELKKLRALKNQLEATNPKAPMGEKERDLLHSIIRQHERYDPNTLSPKQWAFIARFYTQIELRLQKRYANRTEGKRER